MTNAHSRMERGLPPDEAMTQKARVCMFNDGTSVMSMYNTESGRMESVLVATDSSGGIEICTYDATQPEGEGQVLATIKNHPSRSSLASFGYKLVSDAGESHIIYDCGTLEYIKWKHIGRESPLQCAYTGKDANGLRFTAHSTSSLVPGRYESACNLMYLRQNELDSTALGGVLLKVVKESDGNYKLLFANDPVQAFGVVVANYKADYKRDKIFVIRAWILLLGGILCFAGILFPFGYVGRYCYMQALYSWLKSTGMI